MDENYGFDRFLLERWGSANAGEDQKERRTACRKFQKALKDNDVAAAGTIRAWFGLGKDQNQTGKNGTACFCTGAESSGAGRVFAKGIKDAGNTGQ